jgi:hypothetical protein
MRMRPAVAVASLAFAASATAIVQPRYLRLGATRDESRQVLPGDDLVTDLAYQTTMAVTIDAPAAEVWPWIVQMGVDRAGFYSALWVENGLLRLGVHNADHVVPEWQDLAVGDHIWFIPEHYATPRFGPVVTSVDPPHALILSLGALDQPCPGTWQFILDEQPDSRTRLLFRERSSHAQPLGASIANRILRPGYEFMGYRMIAGVRERVERCRVVDATGHTSSAA